MPTTGTLPNGKQPTAEFLESIDCLSSGYCASVGFVGDARGDNYPLVETRAAGGPWTANVAPLPSDAAQGVQGTGLTSASCSAPGTCAAVGYYYSNTTGLRIGLLETLSGGVWSAAEAGFPAGIILGSVWLNSVSCPDASTCVAVGDMEEANPPYDGYVVIYTWNAGSWTVQTDAMPDGVTPAKNAIPFLSSVSCADAADCVAVGGFYAPASLQTEPLIVTLASGTWSSSQGPEPADVLTVGTEGHAEPSGDLTTVDCPESTDCVAGGGYVDDSYNTDGFADTLQAGAWRATVTGVPADAPSDPYATMSGISCPASTPCIGYGTYLVHGSQRNMAMLQRTSGSWIAVTTPPAPASQNRKVFGTAFLDGISCVSATLCWAVGTPSTNGYHNRVFLEKVAITR